MRILKISDVFFPRVNGVSTSIETFRRDLTALGHEVVLVAPAYSKAADDSPGHPDLVCRVPARAVPRDPEDRIMSFGCLRRSLDVLARHKFDVVHIHTPFLAHYAGLRFARKNATPVVATYHTLFEEYLHHYVPLLPRKLTGGLARRFSRSQCNHLDAVIAPSQAMQTALREYGVERRIEILPTGLPAERFQKGNGTAFRRRHGLGLEQPLLLFVGRAAHEKNIGFLIEMMLELRKRRSDALLLIAGEGPAEGALRAQARRLGLDGSVHFLGYFDRGGELQDCYSAADVFVFSSLTETQGLVLLEAMAQGVPVVAIPRMGTIDILGPGLGCRHAPNERKGFAQVVCEVLADKAACSALGAQAREYAESWASKRMAEAPGGAVCQPLGCLGLAAALGRGSRLFRRLGGCFLRLLRSLGRFGGLRVFGLFGRHRGGVDQLHQGHIGRIARARLHLENTRIAARPRLEARPQVDEQLFHHALVAQARIRQAALAEGIDLRQGDQGFDHAAQLLGLRHRSANGLMAQQRGRHVAQHRMTV